MATSSTLADLFIRADRQHSAVILPDEGTVTSYEALSEQIEVLAAQLQAAVHAGQPVAIVGEPGEDIAPLVARAKAGASAVPSPAPSPST